MEAGPSSVAITDGKGIVTYVNPAFAQLTGYSQEDVLGRRRGLEVGPATHPIFMPSLWRTLSRGLEWRGSFVTKRRTASCSGLQHDFTDQGRERAVSHFVSLLSIYQSASDTKKPWNMPDRNSSKKSQNDADLQASIQDPQREVEARRRGKLKLRNCCSSKDWWRTFPRSSPTSRQAVLNPCSTRASGG